VIVVALTLLGTGAQTTKIVFTVNSQRLSRQVPM